MAEKTILRVDLDSSEFTAFDPAEISKDMIVCTIENLDFEITPEVWDRIHRQWRLKGFPLTDSEVRSIRLAI